MLWLPNFHVWWRRHTRYWRIFCEYPFACNWSHTWYALQIHEQNIDKYIYDTDTRWDCKHRISYPEVGDVDLGLDDWKSVSLGEDISNSSWPARIHIWRFPKMGMPPNHSFWRDFTLYIQLFGYLRLWKPPFQWGIVGLAGRNQQVRGILHVSIYPIAIWWPLPRFDAVGPSNEKRWEESGTYPLDSVY